MNPISNPEVAQKFAAYPEHIQPLMLRLRQFVWEVLETLESPGPLEETLKWGEPSYILKKGSTLRMDWKEKKPEQYALYFKCTSKLVPTFKLVFGDLFTYEGDRAIVFQLDEALPEQEIRECIAATLCYHRVKDLPYLGMRASAS